MPPLNNFQKSCLALAVGNSLVSLQAHAATIVVNHGDNCYLKDAISAANNNAPVNGCTAGDEALRDTIGFAAANPILSYTAFNDSYAGVNSALPTITSDITIQGNGLNGLVVERSVASTTPDFRLLALGAGADLKLVDTTLQNGKAPGGFFGGGGAIFVYQAVLTLDNSTITGNNSPSVGGGIFAFGSDVNLINDSSVTLNNATAGAGINLENYSNLTVIDSTVSNNTATASFGGIYSARPDTFTITNSTISGNRAGTFAAGVGVFGDNTTTMTITGGQITGNSAATYGGGIYSFGMTVDISDVAITGNGAGNGAGIYINDSVATVTDTTISNNTATMSGGGVQVKASSNVTISASTLTGNNTSGAAGNGGAICSADSTLMINNTEISGSSTDGNGAAIFSTLVDDTVGLLEINKSTISGNIAGGQGGAVFHTGSGFLMRASTVSGNQAGGRSALSLGGAAIDLIGSTIYNNATTGAGPDAVSMYSLGANLTNTIVAASNTADCNPASGMVSQNNWFEDASCDGTANGKALLNPLADNSVSITYTTWTHMPTLGSGINGGGSGLFCGGSAKPILQTDQRGEARGVASCDIGSVEGGLAGPVEEDSCFVGKSDTGTVFGFCL